MRTTKAQVKEGNHLRLTLGVEPHSNQWTLLLLGPGGTSATDQREPKGCLNEGGLGLAHFRNPSFGIPAFGTPVFGIPDFGIAVSGRVPVRVSLLSESLPSESLVSEFPPSESLLSEFAHSDFNLNQTPLRLPPNRVGTNDVYDKCSESPEILGLQFMGTRKPQYSPQISSKTPCKTREYHQ